MILSVAWSHSKPVTHNKISNQTNYQAYTPKQLMQLLNWVPDQYRRCNLCPGYFKIPKLVQNNPHPLPWKKLPSQITADGPTILKPNGVSVLKKNVVVTQPGRIIKADKAYIYRNKNHHIDWVKLHGNVHLRQPDHLLVGQQAYINFKNHTAVINNAAYYLRRYNAPNTLYHAPTDGWGTAQQIRQLPNHVIILKHATYSTCAPKSPAWKIQASKLVLNKNSGRGYAHNVVLKVKHIPVFYFPYFSFPISNKRKSGLLYPSFGYNSEQGGYLKLPIYWNMAPNYDSTWYIRPMTDRGVLFSTLFRYLSKYSLSNLYLSFIPEDQALPYFKRNNINKYNPVPAGLGPYLNDLRRASNNRAYVSFNNTFVFNRYWSADAIINYVTDDYFFHDFGTTYGYVAANQLLNKVDLKYQGVHWNFLALVQGYETLHQLSNFTPVNTFNQYSRVPQLNLGADYPNSIAGFDFTMSSELTNFMYHSNYNPLSFTMPVGWRLHVRPSVSRPFDFAEGYVTPKVALDNTNYFSQLAAPAINQSRPGFNASRNIPIASLDSGLYMQDDFHFKQNRFIQTFEPRVFYLYVPHVNQNRYPNFDGQELPFTYPQLFRDNRFTGLDRLQNANQVSIGLTSRTLSGATGDEKLKADIGMTYYFTRPRVTLPGANTAPDERISPIVGDLSYSPSASWSLTSSAAVDTEEHNVNNADLSLSYHPQHNRSITFGYQFVQTVDGINIGRTDLIHIGAAWPITKRISGLSYMYYDLEHEHPLTYFAGLQYDTCCWAVRIVAARSFSGTETNAAGVLTRNLYSSSYYVQLMFKGLGDVGNADPGNLISQAVSGYFDPFAMR
ncbi:MAG: LPS assembly protein LptD [Gammaproteobacteria bacterium]|nr:LPS assembly protein LptD [Gammaproteobacteria bacterium]